MLEDDYNASSPGKGSVMDLNKRSSEKHMGQKHSATPSLSVYTNEYSVD